MLAREGAKTDVFQVVYLPSPSEKGCLKKNCFKNLRTPYLMKSLLHAWVEGQSYCRVLKLIDTRKQWKDTKDWNKVTTQMNDSADNVKVLILIFSKNYLSGYTYSRKEEILNICVQLIPKRKLSPWGKVKQQDNVIYQITAFKCFVALWIALPC